MKTLEENFEKYKKFSKAEAMHFGKGDWGYLIGFEFLYFVVFVKNVALLRNPNTDAKILKNLQELKTNY